jgi:hypothetical protein
MLNRIVIIHSDLYAKADILIGDSKSIQLEAESNVGKSSLINTLNFLYIIDKNAMEFEGSRDLKPSIKHYFKTTDQSYIIFEINKSGYTYCILVKATPNSEIEYYKFDTSYKEELFFDAIGNAISPLTFDKVTQNILLETNAKPILLTPEEIYKIVYSSDKDKKPVVQITSKVTRKGNTLSNNFSNIYRDLLKSGDIDESAFKKALMVADNKQDKKLSVFADKSKQQIYELRKTKKEIDILRSIKSDFETLTHFNDTYNSLKLYCGKLKFTFIQQFNKEVKSINDQLSESSDLSLEKRTLKTKIEETLKSKRDGHLADFNKCVTQLEYENAKLTEVIKELKIINQYKEGTLEYSGLIENLQRLKNLNASLLTELNKKQTVTESQLTIEITKLKKDIQQLKDKIIHFDKLLGQNISNNIETKIRINNLLSEKVLNLNAEKDIKEKVKKFSDTLKIFDGEINLSDIEYDKTIETIDDVKEKLKKKEKALEAQQTTLKVVKDYNAKQTEYNNREKEIEGFQTIFNKVQNRKNTEEQKQLLTDAIAKIETEKLTAADNAYKVEQEISKCQILLTNAETRLRDFEVRKNKLTASFNRCNTFDIPEVNELVNKNIDEAFQTLENEYGKLLNQRTTRYEQYLLVNLNLKSDLSDIDKFITNVGKRLEAIDDLESVEKELLQTVASTFSKPTGEFLGLYNDFKKFVGKYNRELEEFPVSNITNLSIEPVDVTKLVEALEKISTLENLQGVLDYEKGITDRVKEEDEKLTALEYMITEGKEISFQDLFELRVTLEIDGERKSQTDLNKQVESRATNRVLKLFLFLNVIRRLIESSPDNKIVIYIDEVGQIGPHNVEQIINFCSQYNFIPIFANSRHTEGIEKYFVIKKAGKKQPLIVDERNVKRAKYKNAERVIL